MFGLVECNLAESEIRELWNCAFALPILFYHEKDQKQVAKTVEEVFIKKKNVKKNI